MAERLENVSMICTVYNEIRGIDNFLQSLAEMTHLPAEIVIVDGCSTDGTTKKIEEWADRLRTVVPLRLIVDNKSNIRHHPAPIAYGRNVAIRQVGQSIIAATDAGCTLHPSWLYEITRPLIDDVSIDVVAGWSEPKANGMFEECQAMVGYRPPATIDPETYLPSSRTIAFRKTIWEKVGGYPEIFLSGEDTLFDLRLRKIGARFAFSPAAIVYWRMRPTMMTFSWLIFRYGFGDGYCGLLLSNCVKNCGKVGMAILLAALAIVVSLWFIVPLVLYLWLLPFLYKMREALRIRLLVRYPLISLLKIVSDISYVTGYIKGAMAKKPPQFSKIPDHSGATC